MTTITMPKGSNASVTVTLESIRDKYSSEANVPEGAVRAEDYLCLGIRKGTEITNTLYIVNTKDSKDATHASGKINMNSGDTVELVPLLSTKKLSDGCEIAQTGAVVSAALAALGNAFDFSSVYRVHAECAKATDNTADIVNWTEKLDFVCSDFTSGTGWILMGVGDVKDKDGKIAEDMMFACCWGRYNSLGAYSEDGVHWIKHTGTVPNYAGANKKLGAYSGDKWCAVGNNLCQIRSVSGDVWSNISWSGNVNALAYGNDIFMAINLEGSVYTLNPIDSAWSGPVASLDIDPVFLCYNEDLKRWIAGANKGETRYSTDNGVTWDSLDDSLATVVKDGQLLSDCCCSHGYFYTTVHIQVGTGSTAQHEGTFIVRSIDGNNWEKVCDVDMSGETKMIPYKNRLYLFNKSGVIVGMFDPSDSGPTAE